MGKLTIEELAENYGTLDLLTAYIMRTANVSLVKAKEWVHDIDGGLERILEEKADAMVVTYICKDCGSEFQFDADDFDCGGNFHPDGEETLWGHIQIEHPYLFEEVRNLETPFMIEVCYDMEGDDGEG